MVGGHYLEKEDVVCGCVLFRFLWAESLEL